MGEDYLLLFLVISFGLYLLGCLWDSLTCLSSIDYWHDGKLAAVLIFCTSSSRFLRKSEYVSFTFEKSQSGKWKYIIDISDVKKRVIGFAIIFSVMVFLYIYFDYRPFPSFWPFFKSILISAVFSFTTLITYPLEAYIVLKRDLRKKERDRMKK